MKSFLGNIWQFFTGHTGVNQGIGCDLLNFCQNYNNALTYCRKDLYYLFTKRLWAKFHPSRHAVPTYFPTTKLDPRQSDFSFLAFEHNFEFSSLHFLGLMRNADFEGILKLKLSGSEPGRGSLASSPFFIPIRGVLIRLGQIFVQTVSYFFRRLRRRRRRKGNKKKGFGKDNESFTDHFIKSFKYLFRGTGYFRLFQLLNIFFVIGQFQPLNWLFSFFSHSNNKYSNVFGHGGQKDIKAWSDWMTSAPKAQWLIALWKI